MNTRNFEIELRELINTHCLENESNSPDYVLAEFILDNLDAFTTASKRRDEYYKYLTVDK